MVKIIYSTFAQILTMKFIVWLGSLFFLQAQIPTYYSTIDFSQSPENIYLQLHHLVTDTHSNLLPYTSNNSIDTWDVIKQSDLEDSNHDWVLLVYGYDDSDTDSSNDRIRDKGLSCHTSSCAGKWNREHVYAKSFAQPAMETDIPGIGTDL